MTQAERIVGELERAVGGQPWHGPSLTTILRGMGPAQAAARPVKSVHTIWELVRHVTAWTNEVGRRLDGHPAGEPEEGDWPKPTGRGAAAWRRDRAALVAAHRRLVRKVARLSDRAFAQPSNDPRKKGSRGVSRYALLHGLAQHHAYHGGQMSLVKKALATPVR